MKKLLSLLVSTILLIPNLQASDNSFRIEVPASWEYASEEDLFEFSLTNLGEDYTGQIALFAKPVGEDNEYLLYQEEIALANQETFSEEILLNDEMGLPVGFYEFFLKYETADGIMEEIPASRCNTRVLAPTNVNKIPITTIKYDRLSVYPNPVKETTTIATETSTFSNVSIFDTAGRQVYHEEVKDANEVKLNLNTLSQGHYVVKVLTEKGPISKVMNVKKK